MSSLYTQFEIRKQTDSVFSNYLITPKCVPILPLALKSEEHVHFYSATFLFISLDFFFRFALSFNVCLLISQVFK